MRTLEGKRVLITGGAQGIGLALATRFAARGSEVLLTDLREDALAQAIENFPESGSPPRPYRLDVTDPAAIESLLARVHREAGRVDVLVNNAGVVFGGPFLDVPLEKHLATYRVNVDGLVAVTRAFLPDLISGDDGHLLNMASASGLIGLPFGATYASSKWAVIGFSDSLRLELELLGHRHVHVTTACPSYVGTGLFDGVRPPFLSRLLPAERLADQVLRAVERNRLYVRSPWLVKLTPALKGLLPTRVFERISGLLGVTSSMSHWRGRN
jgi:all-trans-retinol dehydrogenase (NAD+)